MSSLNSHETYVTDSSSIFVLPSLNPSHNDETPTIAAGLISVNNQPSSTSSSSPPVSNSHYNDPFNKSKIADQEDFSIECLPSVLTTNHEKECELLQRKVEFVSKQLDEHKEENKLLKSQCQFLKDKLEHIKLQQVSLANAKENEEKTKTMNNSSNNNDSRAINSSYLCSTSPDTFVDVNFMIMNEKLENFLVNANRKLTDKNQLCETMKFLIENICSLIEFEKKSDDVQKLKCELLTKIDKYEKDFENEPTTKQQVIKSNHSQENVSSQTDNNSLTSNERATSSISIQESLNLSSFEKLSVSLVDELNTVRAEANMFKDKISKQNELIKILINNFPPSQPSTSSSIGNNNNNNPTSSSESITLNQTLIKSEEDKPNIPVQIKDTNQNDNDEDEDDYYTSPGTSPTDFVFDRISRIRKQQQIPTTTTTNQIEPRDTETETLTEENVNAPTENVTYLYNLNDFIAVDSTLQYGNQLDNETNNNLDVPYTSNHQLSIFKCPSCQISIDSNQISTKVIYDHVTNCDLDKHNVCMFCLKLFDKNNQGQAFEAHVEGHLNEQNRAQNFFV